MEKEISSGTMLGIVLIALAAVIGLGFGVFSIAKGVANEGTTNVQDNLGTVSESAFEDYNDKIVTGTMVKSAVTTFQGKSVGILINTTAMDKEVKPYANHETIWNSQENRTPKLPAHAACPCFLYHSIRLTSGGRLSSFAVFRRRRL